MENERDDDSTEEGVHVRKEERKKKKNETHPWISHVLDPSMRFLLSRLDAGEGHWAKQL